jgi:hypothetical protein
MQKKGEAHGQKMREKMVENRQGMHPVTLLVLYVCLAAAAAALKRATLLTKTRL